MAWTRRLRCSSWRCCPTRCSATLRAARVRGMPRRRASRRLWASSTPRPLQRGRGALRRGRARRGCWLRSFSLLLLWSLGVGAGAPAPPSPRWSALSVPALPSACALQAASSLCGGAPSASACRWTLPNSTPLRRCSTPVSKLPPWLRSAAAARTPHRCAPPLGLLRPWRRLLPSLRLWASAEALGKATAAQRSRVAWRTARHLLSTRHCLVLLR